VARKEDGFYIDPRTNGGKNIEAITLDDVVITDGNGTIISRHAKRQNDASNESVVEETEDEEKKEYVAKESRDEGKTDDKKDEEGVTGEENLSEDKNTRRKRREVAVSKDNDGNDSKKSDVHPVSILRNKKLCTFIFREDIQNSKCLVKIKPSIMQKKKKRETDLSISKMYVIHRPV
jgi:hypothetical protein